MIKNKVKIPVLALLLFITCMAQTFKKSINQATYYDLIAVHNIKTYRATQIIKERGLNGDFKGIEDFRRRMKGKGVGEVSIEKLAEEFSFK